jgi:hypothetical protein
MSETHPRYPNSRDGTGSYRESMSDANTTMVSTHSARTASVPRGHAGWNHTPSLVAVGRPITNDPLTNDHTTAPKAFPIAAVTSIAITPQKVTRAAALHIGAPPTRAPTSPSPARNSIDVIPTIHTRNDPPNSAATKRGSAAPTAKVAAEVKAA